MLIKQINVRRLSVISSRPFESVVEGVDSAIGHPDMAEFAKGTVASKTLSDLERVVHPMLGKSGLMQFVRFDLGAVLAKDLGPATPKSLRIVAGNPLIMQAMLRHVADAGSYAPVTILIDERPDGVHLSYDLMESFLEPYGNPEALQVARDLDAKVRKMLMEAAGVA